MPRYLFDTIQVQATAPSTTLTAATVASGDSLTAKAARESYLLPAFFHHQVAGSVQIKSTAMHDGTSGITVKSAASQPYPLWTPTNPAQKIARQDTIQCLISGSAVGGQIETGVLPMVYVDPESQNNANLIDINDLRARGTGQIATVVSSHTGGTTGGYSGALALNAAANTYNLIGNRNYALLGAQVDTMCAAVTIKGPGTGQTRVAIPGHNANKQLGANYLEWSSLMTGFPLIPVISTADAGSTSLEVVCNQAGGTFVINWVFMLLN